MRGSTVARRRQRVKILGVVIGLVIVQGNLLPPYLPNPILFGWLPFQFLNYWLYAVELSILCGLLAREIIV